MAPSPRSPIKRLKSFLLTRVAARLGHALLWILCSTVRLTVEWAELADEAEQDVKPAILCCWHGRMLYLPYYFSSVRRKSHLIDVLTSPSEDGEVMARISALFGYGVARGSSYKNPITALRELARRARQGRWTGIIADGSRGPALVAQPGAVMLAKLTGAPVAPVAVFFERRWTLKSWDKMIIPKPFTRGVVIHGRTVTLPQGAGRGEMEGKVLELGRVLNQITARADGYFDKP
jgi:hypothetical protein